MKSPWLFIPLVLAPFLSAGPAAAEGSAAGEPPWRPALDTAVPSDDVLLATGAVIGEIYVRAENIFDPTREDEDRFLFHLANRLHTTTRPGVVERKLLFASGDPYDPRLLEETARSATVTAASCSAWSSASTPIGSCSTWSTPAPRFSWTLAVPGTTALAAPEF